MSQNHSLKLIIYEKSESAEKNGSQQIQTYLEVLQRVLPVSSASEDIAKNTVEMFTDKKGSVSGLLGILQQIKYNQIDYIIIHSLYDLPDNPLLFDNFMQAIDISGSVLIVLNEGLFSNVLEHKIRIYEHHLENYQSLIFQKTIEKRSSSNLKFNVVPFGYFWTNFNNSTIILPYTPYFATKYNIPPIRFNKTSSNIYPGEIVTSIFDWYLAYQSLSYIATKLQELKIPIPRSTYQTLRVFFHASIKNTQLPPYILVMKSGKWKATTVKRILKNSFYTTHTENNTNNLHQSSGIITENSTTLISKETFTAVNELLNKVV